MAVTLLKCVCIALLLIFVDEYFTAKALVKAFSSPTSTPVGPTSQTSDSLIENKQNETNGKVSIHKCCGSGQVYSNSSQTGKKQCVKYSITSSSPLSVAAPQQLFLNYDDVLPLNFSKNDFVVVEGLPQSCEFPDMLLQPDVYEADQFFTLGSGQLVMPHRFWYFQLDDYCIEEFYQDNNFSTKGRRLAALCFENVNHFPSTAITSDGKLNLDFFQSQAPRQLLQLTGKKVIPKCCERNEVGTLGYECLPNRPGYTTPLVEDILAQENQEIVLRIGYPNCFERQLASKFNLTSRSSLLIELIADLGSENNTRLITPEHFCVDDFIIRDSIGLLQVNSLAVFCSDELLDTVLPNALFIEPQEVKEERAEKIKVPKCCPLGSIVVDENNCEPFKSSIPNLELDLMVSNGLNYHFLEFYNISSLLVPNTSLSCNFGFQYPLKIFNESEGNLRISPLGSGDLSVSIHYFVENIWDYGLEISPFCMDISLIRFPTSIEFLPQMFYCPTATQVSLHYPIFLGISVVALLATTVIYFIVPTSGSAKLVTNVGGGRRKRSAPTMAMMLTGRILLCHVFSLKLAFICFILSQTGAVAKASTGCIVIGFINYSALVASFAWLTVYCFDYCRIFRGSFKVSNDVLFLPYSAFGWGIPILLLIATAVAQFQSSRYGVPSSVNPNIGVIGCWFADGTSAFFFFYLPLSLLLLINIGFFTSLLFNRNLMNCRKKNQKMSLRTNQNPANRSKEIQDLKMALKLFFITGIPWIFEILAWVPAFFLAGRQREGNWYFIFEVSNLLNSLRGLIIFLVFVVFQRDVRRYLVSRFWRVVFKKEMPRSSNNTRANESSSVPSQPSTSNSRSPSGDTGSTALASEAAELSTVV